MVQRLILDINSKRNADILISLLKNINFIKHIETPKNPIITESPEMKKVVFEMSSKTLEKFFKNERGSIF